MTTVRLPHVLVCLCKRDEGAGGFMKNPLACFLYPFLRELFVMRLYQP
ncbi:hypothetical protein [Brevibacillus reuszeri]|nr:hypothetical protein [Brevibacillus reuszeri]MED1856630.1 hypothetical protein [Brevibacillus reuszeri]